MKKLFPPAVGAVLLLTLLLAACELPPITIATPTPPPLLVYSAKFLCGLVEARVGPPYPIDKEQWRWALEPGLYSTTINVHNRLNTTVVFKKKAVAANPEEMARGKVSPLKEEYLAANQALSIDCYDIRVNLLGGTWLPGPALIPFMDGFVVIEVPPPVGALNVVAVYTATTQGGMTMDVEVIEPVGLGHRVSVTPPPTPPTKPPESPPPTKTPPITPSPGVPVSPVPTPVPPLSPAVPVPIPGVPVTPVPPTR